MLVSHWQEEKNEKKIQLLGYFEDSADFLSTWSHGFPYKIIKTGVKVDTV